MAKVSITANNGHNGPFSDPEIAMGILRRLCHFYRYLAIKQAKLAIIPLNRPLKGMGFIRRLNKVDKTPSNPHGYL